MQFDLISDFHVEMNDPNYGAGPGDPVFFPWDQEIQSRILIVAGDTANQPLFTIQVLLEAMEFYDHIIYTDGNHEHYFCTQHGSTVKGNMEEFRAFARAHPKVTYLDGFTAFQQGGSLVIGANGWYDFKANKMFGRERQHLFWKSNSNDSKLIRFDPDGYPDKLARSQADALAERVAMAQDDDSVEEIIVVTHTIPHERGMVPDTHPWGYLNGAFMNTEMSRVLEADTKGKIRVWVFGHTHFFYDFDAGRVRFVSNPRGYRNEKRDGKFTGLMQIDTDSPPPRSAFGEIDD